MKKLFTFFMAIILPWCYATVMAQSVTTSPKNIHQNSSPIVITFNATGTALAGMTATSSVYAHTGVILKGESEWKYAPTWGTNTAKYKLSYVSPNVWTLTISNIAEYYGLKSGETVKELAFVFRNSAGTKQTSNILVPVYAEGENPVEYNDPVAMDYPGGIPQMGPVRTSDGKTLFCLAAPDKNKVNLIGSWIDYHPVENTYFQDYNGVRYFWWSIDGLAENTDYLYYFVVDETLRVGDPYARLVLDPNNDKYIPSSVFPNMPAYPIDHVSETMIAVYNTSLDKYDWKVKNFRGVAPEQLVIYELLIRDFTGTEGAANGNGTVEGVIEKLPYLKSLGINAIELLPIMEFDGNLSWGYNPNFYFAPDKAYGTPDAYRRLIDAAHGEGIAVILDVVFNQTAGLHPWYQMYSAAKSPFYNASAPHAYSVLNDWKQENPLVQQQFKDVLKYWMTAYNVDGFRFDLVKGLGDDSSYGAVYNAATNTWSGVTEDKTNEYNSTRVARMKELHAAMKEVNPDAYFINENLAGAKEENEMAADGELNWANINNASCQFAMGWAKDCDLNRFYAPDDSRTIGSTVSYAESHDEERMAFKVGKYGADGIAGNIPMTMRRLGSVAAMMLMAPGAHMIWQFQEFGADQTTKNADGSGNDTGNKKVVWSYLDNEYRAALKDIYSKLNGIRANSPRLFSNSSSVVMNCKTTSSTWLPSFNIKLVDGASELYCVVNPAVAGDASIEVPFSKNASSYNLVLSSYGVTPSLTGNKVTLPAGAFAIFGTSDVSGIDDIITDGSDAVEVLGGEGMITVLGEYDTLEIYSISGALMNRTEGLTPGIYVAVVDGTPVKVQVR